MEADSEIINKFRSYIGSVLASKKSPSSDRYLSKNNNNILRIPSILNSFPNALIIIPFRDPVQQANSLLLQHRRFHEKQKEDSFVRHYMNWLVHHEFGGNHKPFCFPNESSQFKDLDDINYWLELWNNTYKWLSQYRMKPVVFLSYEQFTKDPETTWAKLTERADIPPEVHAEDKIVLKDGREVYGINNDLLNECTKTYALLKSLEEHSINNSD